MSKKMTTNTFCKSYYMGKILFFLVLDLSVLLPLLLPLIKELYGTSNTDDTCVSIWFQQ